MTNRTQCTTRRREEVTPQKVEGAETWFEVEMDHGYSGGQGALAVERGRRERGAYRGSQKANNSAKTLTGKTRADFCAFLKPVGFKD